jgi:flavin reductase (DIM6/NTAB) family NADH-FMN oxidoreductase RutF
MKKSLGAINFADPLPLWLIATYDKDGKPNMMAAGAGAICNMRPPCLMIGLRGVTYTHETILERKAFTVNIPSEENWREADYAGMVTGKNSDKFKDTGFTPVRSTLVDAPLIQECPVNFECRLMDKVELPSHTMFIGEVLNVKVEESVFDGEKGPDVRRIKPIIFSPRWNWKSSGYYSVGEKIGNAYSQKKPPKN